MAKRRRRSRGLGSVDVRCTTETISLVRKRLNSGGFTAEGSYFGVGQPLFFFAGNDPQTSNFGYMRATSRKAARAELLAKCPRFKIK